MRCQTDYLRRWTTSISTRAAFQESSVALAEESRFSLILDPSRDAFLGSLLHYKDARVCHVIPATVLLELAAEAALELRRCFRLSEFQDLVFPNPILIEPSAQLRIVIFFKLLHGNSHPYSHPYSKDVCYRISVESLQGDRRIPLLRGKILLSSQVHPNPHEVRSLIPLEHYFRGSDFYESVLYPVSGLTTVLQGLGFYGDRSVLATFNDSLLEQGGLVYAQMTTLPMHVILGLQSAGFSKMLQTIPPLAAGLFPKRIGLLRYFEPPRNFDHLAASIRENQEGRFSFHIFHARDLQIFVEAKDLEFSSGNHVGEPLQLSPSLI